MKPLRLTRLFQRHHKHRTYSLFLIWAESQIETGKYKIENV